MSNNKDCCTTCGDHCCNYSKNESVCIKCVNYKSKLISHGCYDGATIKNFNLYGR